MLIPTAVRLQVALMFFATGSCPTASSTKAVPCRAVWYIGLFVISMAALALRSITLGESLWLDELHTSWVVAGELSDVAPRAAAGNQSPVFYWAVWLLLRVVPENEISLRAASWLAGGALVIAVGLVARRWTADAALGLVAALFVTADPNCVYYAREARPYAWVALLALAHVMVFRRRLILARSHTTHCSARFWRIAWITLAWALFYTHYTSLLLLLAELVYLTLTPLGRRACRWKQRLTWIIDTAWVLIGCLPALPILWQISERRENWTLFIKPQGVTALWTLFPCQLYVGAPIALAALFVVWNKWHARRSETRRLRSFLPLLACWYLVPVGVAWTLTYAGLAPLLHRRYVWLAVVALFLHAVLWGSVAATRRGRQLYAGLLLLLGIAYWISLPPRTWTNHSREDWRSALALIAQQSGSARWPVLLRAGLIEDRQLSAASSPAFREYCTFPLRGLYSIADRPGALVPVSSDQAATLGASTRAIIAAAPGAWLVYRGAADQAVPMAMGWQRLLREDGIRIELVQIHAFSGVTVVQVRVQSS